MTQVADLPEGLSDGTLTCCKKCGRMAIFGHHKPCEGGPEKPVWDEWRCGGCGTFNESPVKTKEGT